jgi:hypothetical protein
LRIDVPIGGKLLMFTRHSFTGRAELLMDGESLTLQDPYDPATHYSLKLTQKWVCAVEGHDVVIEKTRPLIFAGFRPQSYRLYVDGHLMAERHGY